MFKGLANERRRDCWQLADAGESSCPQHAIARYNGDVPDMLWRSILFIAPLEDAVKNAQKRSTIIVNSTSGSNSAKEVMDSMDVHRLLHMLWSKN
jgi:hypothetical protein